MYDVFQGRDLSRLTPILVLDQDRPNEENCDIEAIGLETN